MHKDLANFHFLHFIYCILHWLSGPWLTYQIIFAGIGAPSARKDLDEYIGTSTDAEGRVVQACLLCHAFYHRTKYNVRTHLESKHFPNSQQYPCAFCDKIVYTRKAYDMHMHRYHKQSK